MTDDPFFALGADSTWNACLGKQGDELNYLDGYKEAAFELVDAVIERKLLGKRDTLVLPILYTARHAIELVLKYSINQLAKHSIVKAPHKQSHDIQIYFGLLIAARIGDRTLAEILERLRPFVYSMGQIDDDGQALRYHVGRDGEESLQDYALANLLTVRTGVRNLMKLIDDLRFRTDGYIAERNTKAFTPSCSRKDLLTIAHRLPQRKWWNTTTFVSAKHHIQWSFKLSSSQFSAAVDVIKNNREMKAILGQETFLVHLSDDKAIAALSCWREIHPIRSGHPGIVKGSDIRFKDLLEDIETDRKAVDKLLELLNTAEIADLEAVYFHGRDGWFSEHYEGYVEQVERRLSHESDLRERLYYLFNKTNLLKCFRDGAKRLGRLSLYDRLATL